MLKYSDNDACMIDNFGGESAEHAVEKGGVDMLHTHMAFWALYADVQEAVEWPEGDNDD